MDGFLLSPSKPAVEFDLLSNDKEDDAFSLLSPHEELEASFPLSKSSSAVQSLKFAPKKQAYADDPLGRFEEEEDVFVYEDPWQALGNPRAQSFVFFFFLVPLDSQYFLQQNRLHRRKSNALCRIYMLFLVYQQRAKS